MASVRKSVIVRKFSRDWYAGYAVANFGHDAAELEILDLTGKVLRIAWNQVKWVCYVREFPAEGSAGAFTNDSAQPERLLRRKFSTRPRISGLWLSLTLADGEELEGMAANDRSLIDGVGLLLTPPDTRSNTQRVFIPRTAIRELTVLGVISPSAPTRQKAGPQAQLFEMEAFDANQAERR